MDGSWHRLSSMREAEERADLANMEIANHKRVTLSDKIIEILYRAPEEAGVLEKPRSQSDRAE